MRLFIGSILKKVERLHVTDINIILLLEIQPSIRKQIKHVHSSRAEQTDKEDHNQLVVFLITDNDEGQNNKVF